MVLRAVFRASPLAEHQLQATTKTLWFYELKNKMFDKNYNKFQIFCFANIPFSNALLHHQTEQGLSFTSCLLSRFDGVFLVIGISV